MAVVVPLFLPLINPNQPVTITSLHNPTPGFQTLFDMFGFPGFVQPANATRNELGTSFGFPHTNGINIGTNAALTIPTNAYAVVPPSRAGYAATNDAINSLLLIDVDVAPVQPGLSRLRVDYTDVHNVAQTSYFDMPFWENWDVHPSQIQELVDYIEEAVNFFQDWLNRLGTAIQFESRHLWLKGLTVSGGILTTQANQNLSPTLQPHTLPPFMFTARPKHVSLAKDLPPIPVLPLTSTFTEGITAVNSTVFPGQELVLRVSGGPFNHLDTISILGTPVPTHIDSVHRTYTATMPNNIAYTSTVPVNITNGGRAKSPTISVTLKARPFIASISGPDNLAYGAPGDNFIISGRDFTSTGVVTFTHGLTATILNWSDDRILGIVPVGVSPGNAILTTQSGSTAAVFFNVYNPYILADFKVTPHLSVITTSQTITATGVFDSNNITSSWSIVTNSLNIGSGNATYGTITQNGVYTAPAFASTPLTISLVSNYKSPLGAHVGQASVVVLPNANTLTITPSVVTVAPSYNVRFIVKNGSTVLNDVQWYVNGTFQGDVASGFIDFNGIYTAPNAIPRVQTVYVTAVAYVAGNPIATHAAVRIGNN